jgi:uncharacterized protein YecT (DUF1311 family)
MTGSIACLRGAALLACLCLPAPAMAQERALEDSYSRAYKACMDRSGGVTASMLDCGNAEYTKLDAALNAAYREAANGLAPGQRNLLRDSQRAWLGYRDTSCSFMTRLGDRGSMASLSDQSCLLRVTAERTRWLKDLASP